MRLRLASVAFLLGAVATGLSWLTLLPLIVELSRSAALTGNARALLPGMLVLSIAGTSLLAFVVLYLGVARPLRATERTLDQIGRMDLESPLGQPVGSLEGSIQRLVEALRSERALTQKQLEDLKASNERLSRLQAELVASERLSTVGKLAAGVAHEIGNPLSGILGYLSLASARAEDPELSDYLARIDREVQRIDQIVRGLLDLGRSPKGQTSAVDLSQLARTCVDLLKATPELSGIRVDLDLGSDVVARAEPGPVSQVLLNLLLNAAQAMDGKGDIQVRAARAGGRLRVDVRDFGPGIPPEVMARMFEPFFTTKTGGHGTGLGLAISRHLATQMGGELHAENGQPAGAVFTLVLPAA